MKVTHDINFNNQVLTGVPVATVDSHPVNFKQFKDALNGGLGFSMPVSHRVTGTVPSVVGAVFLAAGNFAGLAGYLGCLSVTDSGTLLLGEPNGAIYKTISVTGLISAVQSGTGFTIPVSGFYELHLYADSPGATVQLLNVTVLK